MLTVTKLGRLSLTNSFVRSVLCVSCTIFLLIPKLQNIAEIDEIPSSQKVEKVNLPAAERAIYLELEHHLRALDMTVKRAKKSESDREKRLNQALGESK